MLILGAGTATSYAFTNVTTLVGTTPQGELPDRPVTTTFQYDPFGRKVRKIVADGVHPPQTTRYAYSGWQVLEEQDNTGTPQASYVYGRYIDEPIQMKRGDDTVYYHSDDLYNVTALTNNAGNVVERYRYDDFGAAHAYSPTGDPRIASSVGNPYLFTGRAYDSDLGLYDYRTRHLHPGMGRFTTRDQIGLWGDPMNMGNPYSYVGNAPGAFVDPYGLERWGEQSYLADVADVGYGYFISGPIDLVVGAVTAVFHPLQTAEGLATLGRNLYNDFSGTTGGLASVLYAQFEDSDTTGEAALGISSTVVPLAPGAGKAVAAAARTGRAALRTATAARALRAAAVAEKGAAGGGLACEMTIAAERANSAAAVAGESISTKGVLSLPEGIEPYQLRLFPDEAYNRTLHYGRTPTSAQRSSVPSGMEFDHDPTLVQHYYEGVDGNLPGFNLTHNERLEYSQSLSSGGARTPGAQRAQGGAAAAYSKQQKKLWGLE